MGGLSGHMEGKAAQHRKAAQHGKEKAMGAHGEEGGMAAKDGSIYQVSGSRCNACRQRATWPTTIILEI